MELVDSINIRLLDCHLGLTSNHPGFFNFIRQFSGLQTDDTRKSAPGIYVNLKLTDNFQIGKNHRQISRNMWLGNSSVFVSEIERFPGLKLEAKIEQNRLYIDAFLIHTNQPLLKRIISHCKSGKRNKEVLFIGLLYYTVFLPLFYFLERFRNLSLLHASAVEYHEKGIILAGLGGIGKSTFSLGTLLLEGCRFISDNLIFYDSDKIYSCPEPIALDTRSVDILKDAAKHLVPQQFGFTHGRMWYQPEPEAISCEAFPKYLFWLQRGNENSIVPIDKANCLFQLLNMNLLAKELREYYILAAAFDLAFSHFFSPTDYSEKLSTLLSDVDCYVLQFKAGDDIETVLNETVCKIIV